MALGSFFFIIQDTKITRKVIYLKEENSEIFIGENELLRIRTGHSDKSFVLTFLPGFQLFSYKKSISVKEKMVEFIAGVILVKEVPSNPYKGPLKMFVKKMEEIRNKSNKELEEIITLNFNTYFENPQLILDKSEIEKRLSEKIKLLNKAGKFDESNQFLDIIKKIPKKLYKAHKSAEKYFYKQQFEKAEREYEDSKKYAEKLEEDELVKMYDDKIKQSQNMPSLLKKREINVDNALKNLRKDNFSKAQRFFKKAAEVSEELMDAHHAEEYGLKAKALAEYVKVEKKYS